MAEPGNDGQERTEPATPKRLDEARRKGQVARSRELTTSALLMSGAAALLLLGPSLLEGLLDLMRVGFTTAPATDGVDVDIHAALIGAITEALYLLAPFFVLTVVVATLAPLALGGWVLSAEAIAFKWDKLDPIKGLKRVFSVRGLMELLKALAKFALLIGVTVGGLWLFRESILGLDASPPMSALIDTLGALGFAFLTLAGATLLIAAVDVPFQIWSHARQLRMSMQEIKDEMKETEGKPEVKGRLRALQREVAQRRMMEELPTADVVVTNPTHFAVALRYDAGTADAPVLVAKGADLMAERIRVAAAGHGIPVLSAPPLARAVFHNTRLGEEIPAALYTAVAQVLAYVYRLREGGPAAPPTADDLAVPEHLARAAPGPQSRF